MLQGLLLIQRPFVLQDEILLTELFSIQVKLVLQGRVAPIPVLSFNSHIPLANSKLKKVSLSFFRRASKKISIPWQLSYVWDVLPRDNRSQSDRIPSEVILLSGKKKKKSTKILSCSGPSYLTKGKAICLFFSMMEPSTRAIPHPYKILHLLLLGILLKLT